MKRCLILAVVFSLVLNVSVFAHTPYLEETDFSFASPFVIPPSPYGPPAVMNSTAIFAFLDNNDTDVYTFTLSPTDFYSPVIDPVTGQPVLDPVTYQPIMQFSPVIVSASALPPACTQYKNFYPKTVLMGIGLPAPTEELPFDVPPGYGVVVAENPHVIDREILTEVGISWYLPEGLTQQCLYEAPWSCDYTNTISQAVFAPGQYFLIVYADEGRFGDYTANIGFLETGTPLTPEQEAIVEYIKSGAGYRLPCVEP